MLTAFLPQDRKTICEILCNGLARQEYRGYDSAGIGIDGDKPGEMFFFKEVGKVAGLRKHIAESNVDTSKTLWAVAENFRYMSKFLRAAEEVRSLGRVKNFRVNAHSLISTESKYFSRLPLTR